MSIQGQARQLKLLANKPNLPTYKKKKIELFPISTEEKNNQISNIGGISIESLTDHPCVLRVENRNTENLQNEKSPVNQPGGWAINLEV
jgi:hypothetical protein